MEITEKEFEEVEHGLDVAFNEGCLDENVAFPAFEKMKEVYKRHQFVMEELETLKRRTTASWILSAYKRQFGE